MKKERNLLEKITLKLKIVQIVSNEERHKKGLKRLGDGYFTAYRLNPYNPLCYILLLITIPFFILYAGCLAVYKLDNPFKWS